MRKENAGLMVWSAFEACRLYSARLRQSFCHWHLLYAIHLHLHTHFHILFSFLRNFFLKTFNLCLLFICPSLHSPFCSSANLLRSSPSFVPVDPGTCVRFHPPSFSKATLVLFSLSSFLFDLDLLSSVPPWPPFFLSPCCVDPPGLAPVCARSNLRSVRSSFLLFPSPVHSLFFLFFSLFFSLSLSLFLPLLSFISLCHFRPHKGSPHPEQGGAPLSILTTFWCYSSVRCFPTGRNTKTKLDENDNRQRPGTRVAVRGSVPRNEVEKGDNQRNLTRPPLPQRTEESENK